MVPIIVRRAQPDGSLSDEPNLKWGAVTTSSLGTTICPTCGQQHSQCFSHTVPVEAVLGIVAGAVAAAAQRMEGEEAELLGVAAEVERAIETDTDLGDGSPVKLHKLDVLRKFPREKVLRILRIATGR